MSQMERSAKDASSPQSIWRSQPPGLVEDRSSNTGSGRHCIKLKQGIEQVGATPILTLILTFQFQNWFFRDMVKMVKEKPTEKETEEVYPKIEVIG